MTEEKGPYQWTPALIVYYFERVLADMDRRLNERADLIVEAAEKRHDAFAVELLRIDQATTQRFTALNEFRALVQDQQHSYIPRSEIEAQWRRNNERLDALGAEHASFVRRPEHDQLVDRITAVESRLTRDEAEDRGVGARTSTLRQNTVIVVAIGGLLITIIVTLIDHFVR